MNGTIIGKSETNGDKDPGKRLYGNMLIGMTENGGKVMGWTVPGIMDRGLTEPGGKVNGLIEPGCKLCIGVNVFIGTNIGDSE